MSARNTVGKDPASHVREVKRSSTASRPAVSVIVPFYGPEAQARQAMAAMESLVRIAGDELLLVDNTPDQALSRLSDTGAVTLVGAPVRSSPYYARNRGAERASNDWLLFLDADCRPVVNLLDEYLGPMVSAACGAMAGPVLGEPDQHGLIPRYVRSRQFLDQARNLANAYMPMAVTANLLVRRAAWEGVGGFHNEIRSAGDSDFCWRLQEAGWELLYRPRAVVWHRHRDRLLALIRQVGRDAAGSAWLNRRHPGSYPRPTPIRRLLRSGAAVARWTLAGQFERALFRAIDGLMLVAETAGYVLGNVPPARVERNGWRSTSARRGLTLIVDDFPERSKTSILESIDSLSRSHGSVAVDAASRPRHPDLGAAPAVTVAYLEDDGTARRAIDTTLLVGRHPRACARDLWARRRWRRAEPVKPLHVLAPRAHRLSRRDGEPIHSYAYEAAALDALRIGRLLDRPYSVEVRASDLRTPHLTEKLRDAALVIVDSDETLTAVRTLVGEPDASRIEWQRTTGRRSGNATLP